VSHNHMSCCYSLHAHNLLFIGIISSSSEVDQAAEHLNCPRRAIRDTDYSEFYIPAFRRLSRQMQGCYPELFQRYFRSFVPASHLQAYSVTVLAYCTDKGGRPIPHTLRICYWSVDMKKASSGMLRRMALVRTDVWRNLAPPSSG
jgi:hypothetical protein